MPKKSPRATVENSARPTLQMPRVDAESRIQSRIEMGNKLLETSITTKDERETAKSEKRKWSNYNAELLK